MKSKGTNAKYTVICVVFALICAVFVARLINLQFDGERTDALRESTEITVETQVIQALRGNICDRNGNVLVTSSYSYDIMFDYNDMPDDDESFNRTVLALIAAMDETGNTDKRAADYYPFVGEYPSLSYSDKAKTEGDPVSANLKRVIARAELEDTSAQSLVRYIVERYSLDEAGLYTDKEIDSLVRVFYDMMRIQFSPMQPYTIIKGADISLVTYVKELSLEGVTDCISASRTYLYPGYASHILGRVGAITAEMWDEYRELGYDINDHVGIDGCEEMFEEHLRGVDGVLTIEKNASGEIIDQYVSKKPIDGKDVWLTIDIDAQIAAEDALKQYMEDNEKEKGASVAIDPTSGDILALASYPTYDLATFSKKYNELVADPSSPLLNRAIYATYAPGSTFKIAVALAGLEEGAINGSTVCTCNGGYQLGTGKIKCNNHTGLYSLDLVGAIRYSCNAYFIKLGYEMLDIQIMRRYCELLGLGESTGIELPEKTGQVACPENTVLWSAYEEASSYIGQSIHEYTPLQLASYISTVSNGGTRYATHLLHSIHTFSGEVIYEQENEVLSTVGISQTSLSTIKRGMKAMVDGSGSASYYMYTVEGIKDTVCGKSGTAQIGGDRQNCWFAAFAPMEAPTIAVVSLVEDGETGASVSQIDAAVMGAYLNK